MVKKENDGFKLAISSVLIIVIGVIIMLILEPSINVIGFIITFIGCILYLIWHAVYATKRYL